jgi:hypothetical protein
MPLKDQGSFIDTQNVHYNTHRDAVYNLRRRGLIYE